MYLMEPSPRHVGVRVPVTEPSPQLAMAGPESLTALQQSERQTDNVDLEKVLEELLAWEKDADTPSYDQEPVLPGLQWTTTGCVYG